MIANRSFFALLEFRCLLTVYRQITAHDSKLHVKKCLKSISLILFLTIDCVVIVALHALMQVLAVRWIRISLRVELVQRQVYLCWFWTHCLEISIVLHLKIRDFIICFCSTNATTVATTNTNANTTTDAYSTNTSTNTTTSSLASKSKS